MAIAGKGGRPVGLPKTGGREKGVPNRATLTLKEKLEAMSCDPVIELAKVGMDKKNPLEIRVRCLSEIASYLYPKRKPVDDLTDQPTVINLNTLLDTKGGSDGGDQRNPES